MTSSSTPAIELKGIRKDFKIGKEVFNLYENLNFQCEEKDFIILSGESGSGKSTILSIIAGLTRVDLGTVRIFNNLINDMDEEAMAIFRSTSMGIVFQMGHLIDSLTVFENILLPVELAQRGDIDYNERAWSLLNEFYLAHRAHSLPRMLSGGEYQRAAFIRALILDPLLLLIDEPTANQDERTKSVILQKLTSLKGKKTIIVVTHEKNLFPLADRIYLPTNNGLREK